MVTIIGIVLAALLGWGGWVTIKVGKIDHLLTKVEYLEGQKELLDKIETKLSKIEKKIK